MSVEFLSKLRCRSQLLEFCRQPTASLQRRNREGSVVATSTFPWQSPNLESNVSGFLFPE